jgi:hypothetical protein
MSYGIPLSVGIRIGADRYKLYHLRWRTARLEEHNAHNRQQLPLYEHIAVEEAAQIGRSWSRAWAHLHRIGNSNLLARNIQPAAGKIAYEQHIRPVRLGRIDGLVNGELCDRASPASLSG